MAELKPCGLVHEKMKGYVELKKAPGGRLLCPGGYPLRKIDATTWECEANVHRYRMRGNGITIDKFGRAWVKDDPGANAKEAGQ